MSIKKLKNDPSFLCKIDEKKVVKPKFKGDDPFVVDDVIYTKPTNPKDRAATHRVDLTLFPETARVYGAVAMTEGDCKYGGYNYRESGVNISTYVAALGRHIGKYYDCGEWSDPFTGVPHLGNALACIAVLIDGHERGNIKDDRPPVIKSNLYKWAEDISKKLHDMYPNGPSRVTELRLKEKETTK